MLQIGDILLYKKTHSITSRIVSWFTHSEYTHVAIVISNGYVCEIDIDKKLAIRPLRPDNYDIYRYKNGLTATQQLAMKWYAIKRIHTNKGYDWLHILSFALQKLCKTKKTFEEVNKVICSEIVDNLYTHIGIDLVPERIDGDVTPVDLARSAILKRVV